MLHVVRTGTLTEDGGFRSFTSLRGMMNLSREIL